MAEIIVFDLDGTLADCEHRRHFVDPEKSINHLLSSEQSGKYFDVFTNEIWKPDWKSFYEACDKDTPIDPVIHLLEYIGEGKEYGSDCPFVDYDGIEIWSGRCESVRIKTEKWLSNKIDNGHKLKIKMRPIGDYTPDDQLKERWLDEELSKGNTIKFVVDDRKKVVDMWRRRGIFVFDVSQGNGKF